MNIATAKVELAKRILETDNKEIIAYIKAIFESQPENWLEELPEALQASVERGLKQSRKLEGRPHSVVKKRYQQWLKK